MAVTGAYDGLAQEWDTGARHVYLPLARALVGASPAPLRARLVLDVGSGTGVVAEAATALGARVVALDLSVGMVAYQARQVPAVAADAVALPFPGGAFDAALAGFLLNHLHPAPVLHELARAVRPGGVVLASTWARVRRDPVKAAIDGVVAQWGWAPPRWYRAMKDGVEPISGDAERLALVAEQSGLIDVRATEHAVDLGRLDSRDVVAYRLAMPQIAPWVAALDLPGRAEVTRQAVSAVAPNVEAWRPRVILLTGRVGDQPSQRAAARSSESA